MTATVTAIVPAARTVSRSEADAVMRLMAQLPALPRPSPAGEALLRLFR